VLTIQVLVGQDRLWRTPPLSGEPIRCQSGHGDYACSQGGVVMSGGDETDLSTQVNVARRTWVLVVMPHLV
jgi:hypothetical protein